MMEWATKVRVLMPRFANRAAERGRWYITASWSLPLRDIPSVEEAARSGRCLAVDVNDMDRSRIRPDGGWCIPEQVIGHLGLSRVLQLKNVSHVASFEDEVRQDRDQSVVGFELNTGGRWGKAPTRSASVGIAQAGGSSPNAVVAVSERIHSVALNSHQVSQGDPFL